MPELPEVEIIKRGLEKKIVGQTIDKVEVCLNKLLQGSKELLVDKKIISINRRAKMLIINLSGDISLLIHLKLTGQLIYRSQLAVRSWQKISADSRQLSANQVAGGHPSKDMVGDLPNKFTHAIFYFQDGGVLYFNDLRQFGYIKVYKTEEIANLKVLNDLGLEPYDENATPEYLMKIISRRPNTKIKQIIMDQSVLAGVGNIYADEGLYCAKISPLRAGKDLSKTELERIIKCIRSVMDQSFKYGGSSENTFVNAEGKKGEMQNHFQIYRRMSEKCSCGGVIKRTVVGGRGTYYCPVCQK
ncbi:bifunctional DNA-formamidopyrimidine glycosylase/DNA-(apurinic or apyrimidinic site) lyase [Candidatus Berkelbacteria bacterium CG10_big_fil_rev_8_21_14_0_10_41_12]|uniref:Bifunctional DNA-formamidopyrimidine glycosylase/DNA-(Apurinic or apyrimidinic site) lyase n=1 Tax=Candidatus Berkelbacteria bacterium CG10_big_fil_rev_8_21_14_0_10_41_12 TaxID=1974513 RepID=A0A2M6WWJ4_9BACT|nr:MAG: bifunctional DNA-formamidopyrimidine glycosylase/DNA-(apurinic or apyrimidinic site) lyase [Candidatus Berkelbacteria bacterium CG10_big_fil_rev_8_21_14_0_10_41_12]